MSDFLLKLTLGAAEETLGQATQSGADDQTRRHSISRDTLSRAEGMENTRSKQYHGNSTPTFDMLAQGYERYGRLAPSDLRQGVGFSAEYQITVEVSAHNPKHPWQDMLHA